MTQDKQDVAVGRYVGRLIAYEIAKIEELIRENPKRIPDRTELHRLRSLVADALISEIRGLTP